MLKNIGGKWKWIDNPTPLQVLEKTNAHFEYLSTCPLVVSPVLGECYFVGQNPTYWMYENVRSQ